MLAMWLMLHFQGRSVLEFTATYRPLMEAEKVTVRQLDIVIIVTGVLSVCVTDETVVPALSRTLTALPTHSPLKLRGVVLHKA